jgi:hypothetical protein
MFSANHRFFLGYGIKQLGQYLGAHIAQRGRDRVYSYSHGAGHAPQCKPKMMCANDIVFPAVCWLSYSQLLTPNLTLTLATGHHCGQCCGYWNY